ncbi:MAG: SOS response-associated peptidase [Gemmatimonas sp.]
MCGRYGFGNPARLGTLPFGTALPLMVARYNVPPSQPVPLVRQRASGRDAVLARWGLVPYWADDPSIGNRLANARGDSVATKPSFREAFGQRRGLMPADLFYEWQIMNGMKVKQPWCVRLPDDEPFAFGAIWERWKPRDDAGAEPLITCAIITTEPNAVMAPIHDRMPVIVAPSDYDAWLDASTPSAVAQSLVRPYRGPMLAWPISTRVNSPRSDDVECVAPLA